MVTEKIQNLKEERKTLSEIVKFIKGKTNELKIERSTNFDKFNSGGYEIKYEYWNRYNEIKGALTTLKELQKFTNWQKAKVNYEMYLIHNSTSDFIDIEVESFI